MTKTKTLIRSAAAVLILTSGTVVAGCATQPQPRSATLDPANPTARESPPQAVSQVLEPERHPSARAPSAGQGVTSTLASSTSTGSAGSAPVHDPTKTEKAKPEKAKPDKGEVVFTCPMDPEVVLPKPGNCPKCGMKLVPKSSSGSGNPK